MKLETNERSLVWDCGLDVKVDARKSRINPTCTQREQIVR